MTQLSHTTSSTLIFLSGPITWIFFTYLLYRIDRALASKLKLTFLLILNVFLGTLLALLQFIAINLWAHLFTGFGLGYAFPIVAMACATGMLFSLLGLPFYLWSKGLISDA